MYAAIARRGCQQLCAVAARMHRCFLPGGSGGKRDGGGGGGGGDGSGGDGSGVLSDGSARGPSSLELPGDGKDATEDEVREDFDHDATLTHISPLTFP